MKCPKCRCIVQDYCAECPKCYRDLSSVRASLGLHAFRPDPPMLLDSSLGPGQMDRGRFAFSREEPPEVAEADLSWLNVIPEQQSEVDVGGADFEAGIPGSAAEEPLLEAEVDVLPLDMAGGVGEWSPDEDAGRKASPDGKSRLK